MNRRTILFVAMVVSLYRQDVLLAEEQNPDVPLQSFENFPNLRSKMLNLISGAEARVWLVSDYLTDGEIVSSLYIGKYRKLDVRVLLGRAKANQYMSRLRYLKTQNIPVFLKPNTFPFLKPTLLLVDNQLFEVDGELNFMEPGRKYTLALANEQNSDYFAQNFSQACSTGLAAIPKPILDVGRKRHLPKDQPESSAWSKPPEYRGSRDGSFDYDRIPSQKKTPLGLPRKLPSKTIMQKRDSVEQVQRENNWIPPRNTDSKSPISDNSDDQDIRFSKPPDDTESNL